MQSIVALEPYLGSDPSLFLAGGITGCPDWQQELTALLQSSSLVLLNPRRPAFPIDDPYAAHAQIAWEHDHLRKATAIAFWFPCESLCPIVLFELGWAMSDKHIFIGVHPDYQRKQDVLIQTALARPHVQLVETLDELAQQVVDWADRLK
jgi:hypothetical protein